VDRHVLEFFPGSRRKGTGDLAEEGAADRNIDIGSPLVEDERELRCHDPATDDEEVPWHGRH